MMRRSVGFTLIELLVVLVVVTIFATVAVPGFLGLTQSNQVTSQTNLLVRAINFTRSEAIKRGVQVTLTPNGGDLAQGWCIHTGANCTAANQLRTEGALDSVQVTPANSVIAFDGRGILTPQVAQNLTLIAENCDTGDPYQRVIAISAAGRTDVTQGACP